MINVSDDWRPDAGPQQVLTFDSAAEALAYRERHGLVPRQRRAAPRRTPARADRSRAIALAQEVGTTKAARLLGIPYNTLKSWRRDESAGALRPIAPKPIVRVEGYDVAPIVALLASQSLVDAFTAGSARRGPRPASERAVGLVVGRRRARRGGLRRATYDSAMDNPYEHARTCATATGLIAFILLFAGLVISNIGHARFDDVGIDWVGFGIWAGAAGVVIAIGSCSAAICRQLVDSFHCASGQ